MFIQALEIVFTAIAWVLDMFHYLADYFGFGGLLLTLFTIYTIIRLLLQPIFGAAGSDFASQTLADVKSGVNKSARSVRSRIPNRKVKDLKRT